MYKYKFLYRELKSILKQMKFSLALFLLHDTYIPSAERIKKQLWWKLHWVDIQPTQPTLNKMST